MKLPLRPSAAAHRIVRSLFSGLHRGGCGFWKGCGNTDSWRSVVPVAVIGGPLIEYESAGAMLNTSLTSGPAPPSSSQAIAWAWFHLVHVGGTEKNWPWWENDSSVQALMMISTASS